MKGETIEALKPCPCCAGRYRPHILDGNRGGILGVYIWCSECGVQTRLFTYDKIIQSGRDLAVQQATDCWNTRPSPSTMKVPPFPVGLPPEVPPEGAAAVEEVTQEDREAAAKLLPFNTLAEGAAIEQVRQGNRDKHPTVQAFRDHRLAALRSTQPAAPAAVGEVEKLREALQWFARNASAIKSAVRAGHRAALGEESDWRCDLYGYLAVLAHFDAALSSIPAAVDVSETPSHDHQAGLMPADDWQLDQRTVERIVGFLKRGGNYAPNGRWWAWDSEMKSYAEGFADQIAAGEPFKEGK